MGEPRYKLLVRAPEVGVEVLSTFSEEAMSWAAVRAAWDEAAASSGPRTGLVYTVVPVDVEPNAGAWASAGVPWVAPHVQESEALRSPPPCPLCEAGHVPLRPCP
jgi:hypothetical protein